MKTHHYSALTPLCQISLIDAEGKPVQETSSGKQSAPWSQKQIEVWFDKNVERTTGKKPVFQIWPFQYTTIYTFRLPQTFQLEKAGDYKLTARLQVIVNTQDAAGKTHFETISLPEVVAKVQILPEDLAQPDRHPRDQTNSPSGKK